MEESLRHIDCDNETFRILQNWLDEKEKFVFVEKFELNVLEIVYRRQYVGQKMILIKFLFK